MAEAQVGQANLAQIFQIFLFFSTLDMMSLANFFFQEMLPNHVCRPAYQMVGIFGQKYIQNTIL